MNSHVINVLPSCLHLIGRIPLSSSYPDVRTEPKYIVFLSKLLLLFQFCHVCRSGKKPEMTAEQTGTAIVIKAVCTNSSCRKEFIWSSQPFMPGTKIFAGNFLTSTVPFKCKLTVTRNSNNSTRSSKLEYFEYRVSSRVDRVSSRGDKECNARLIFQIHVHVNLAGSLLKTEIFESRL